MKSIYILFVVLMLVMQGCSEADLKLYSDEPRVYLGGYTREASTTFYYDEVDVVRDTLYIPVETMGGPRDYDRAVAIRQVTVYDVEYTIENGVKVDSTVTENPYNAIAGKHFVSFDSEEAKQLMVIPANEVKAFIPVIFLRDPSLKENVYTLKIQLGDNDEFKIGGVKNDVEYTLICADKLVKPNFWGNYPYSGGYGAFGEYSTRKHEFMIEVTGEKINDEWWNTKVYGISGAQNHYQVKFKTALDRYNNDPANIASGAAPMREVEGDLSSKLITFK